MKTRTFLTTVAMTRLGSTLTLSFPNCTYLIDRKWRLLNCKTCGCTLGDEGKSCTSALQQQDIIDSRNNCTELESSELDLVILGAI